jgi:two-component system chemotaxis family response regulator WspR
MPCPSTLPCPHTRIERRSIQGAILLAILAATAAAYALHAHRLRARTRRLIALLAERTEQLAEANTKLEELATTDELTRIANRRHFAEFLQREWTRARRARSSLALLMLDVDFFKRFNDTYGHQTGDACLRRVAGVLQASVNRPADLPARYGGEEFTVVLGTTGRRGALAIAESIRRDVEGLQIPHEASPVSSFVTVSIGVAVADPDADGGTPELLIFTSDEALYRAKENGRNTVVAAWQQVAGDSGMLIPDG